MCAICGIINCGERVDEGLLRKMADAIKYRGPDEEGFYIKDNAGLGHRRLKIIDLHTGQQPIANEDGTVFLVCNGEVYNFAELRETLERKGHRFKSRSDSEVILHLYEEKGVECLQDLRGMFAFAVWDGRKKKLLLARDRIGKKPVVYSASEKGIIFASEIKALLLHPSVQKDIDATALDLFLTYQAVPAPRTIFKGIKKLPAAHYLLWQDGKYRVERYWDLNFTKKIKLKSEEEYAELLWQKLTEAVKLRMISDVPLGAFLSGGIDSSTVVGIMSGLSRPPVKTFSVGFDEESFSELKYAKTVAERFGTEHYEFKVKPDVMEILPKLVWHYNEPFGDSSMVPTYYVARETKKCVTVALNGDGGDENLAGYTRYWQMLLLDRIRKASDRMPKGFKKGMMSALLKGYEKHPSSTFFRIWKWLEEAEREGYGYAYARRLMSFSPEHKSEIYSDSFASEIEGGGSISVFNAIWNRTEGLYLMERMLYADFNLNLADVLTVKMDIAAMANSLESRSPFLDQEFVETIASFPPEMKFRKLASKYILKKKLKGFLPEEILSRKKMGFGIPAGEWFRKDLKDYLRSYLLSEGFARRGYFRAEGVKKMVEDHIAGRAVHTPRLWNLLVFELWYRIFIEGEGT
ncbi:MAG: asparagine synthase (glutamine-hydrolyzing) [Candidatus Omnitrophica bacterium]|nr:asparagine synthase (glutamine-hydrolyzing) [Candidatus Omnitrophota bacterium]